MEGLDELIIRGKCSPQPKDPDNSDSLSKREIGIAAWFTSKSSKKISLSKVIFIIDGLKKIYLEKLKSLKATYLFNEFCSSLLTNSDFYAKPMVMLLGQYSIEKKLLSSSIC